MKNLKNKQDAINYIDTIKTETINKTSSAQNDVEKEIKKHEHNKIQIRKLENQFNMMEFLVKRNST